MPHTARGLSEEDALGPLRCTCSLGDRPPPSSRQVPSVLEGAVELPASSLEEVPAGLPYRREGSPEQLDCRLAMIKDAPLQTVCWTKRKPACLCRALLHLQWCRCLARRRCARVARLPPSVSCLCAL
eukprot:6270708-Heterocapsa_arctica.AAC.2